MKKIVSLIALIMLATGCCFAENLLPDNAGSFESEDSLSKVVFMWKPKGMELGELCRISKNESYSGRSSLEVHKKNPEYYGVFAKAKGDVFKAGETYTASAYVKAPVPMTALIYLITYDELWKVNKGDKFYYMKVGPEWKQIKVTLTLPKDAKILGAIVRVPGDDKIPGVFYVDDLKIESGADASATAPARIESDEQVKVKGVIPAAQTPVLDGRLGDPTWKNAMTIDKFYLTDGSGKAAPQRTEVKMLHDDKNIYFGFKCDEKNADAMKCQSSPGKAVWSDDRVEIHANSLGYATPSAYFSVNADGVYTTKMPFGELNLKPEIKTARGNGFWTAEIAIPAAAYGKAGLAGQTWYFSLGRFHRTSFNGASCIVPIKGGFNKLPEAFQPFVFGGGSALPPVMVLTQGDMTAYSNNSGGNALTFQLNDKNLLSSELQLTVSSMVNGKSVAEQELTAKPPFKNNRAVFYYNTAEKENEMLNFTLKSDGKTIFSSGNNLDIICPPCRVFKTANPLFEGLLKPVPAEKRTFITWQHPVNEENYSLALKYGKAYSQEQRLRELKEAGISIITKDATDLYKSLPSVLPGNYYWDREKLNMDYLSKSVESGKIIPFTVYGYYSISGVAPSGEKGVTLNKDGCFGWLPDPINRQAHKDGVKALMNKYGSTIGIMWVGDEQFWLNHDQGLKMNSPHNQANSTGFLEKANQEVKEKYGSGKFGIPWGMDSKSPDYPYCKRAYISWLHDKLLAVNKETREAVKVKYPDMPLMSDDAYGVPSVVGVQYWNQYADIATYQLGEGGGSAERMIEQYAFTTKMVKDLSGVKKLIVVPHEPLDGYPSGATSLEESRELYSQALRGGADGFHYWPASFGGQDKPPVYAAAVSEGYPLIWQYMLEVTKLLNNTPPLKLPEKADTAIFVSDEALKCDSGSYDRFAVAFSLLGSYAHGWFKFISDTMLEQGRAKLSDYKIIYVPYIQYVKEDTAKKLIEYVENGGTLICGDPKAFENDIFSAPLTQYREKLFGVKSITPDKSPDSTSCNIGSRKLTVDSERFRLLLDGKTKIIGTYADGSPAVVENRVGKGKAFYFGFVPFSRIAVGSCDWKDFIKELHVAQGGTVGYDIWRFKLPEPKVKPSVAPSGKCLTGNYAYWNRHRLNDGTIFNVKLDGVCEITRNGKTQSSSFKDSKLTDRRSIFTRVKEYGNGTPDKFVEIFDKAEASSIIIDLKDKFPLDRLVVYYAGELPDISVSVSSNKQTWTPAGRIPAAKTAPLEVGEAIFKFSDANSRFVKLDFRTREKLFLAELELWRK